MNKLLIIFFAIFSQTLWANDFKKSLSPGDWQELFSAAASINASCVEKVFYDQADLQAGVKRLVEDILVGAGRVFVEKASTLALKKDYPNVCHVLTDHHLKTIGQSNYHSNPCINRLPNGECFQREKRTHKEITYHWPKYFIEVSEKGNDPFPAFAKSNRLYQANRKVAAMFDSLLDVKGPFSITAKVLGANQLISGLTSSYMAPGFQFNPTSNDISRLTETAVLTPFEKLRIRANKDHDQPTYEVNIWPVALSKSVAEYLTICGDGRMRTHEGGFGWPIPGVAMTCPVAMAKDAWPYWDSGMIDYLNPNAVRGIVSATNPISCAADNIASVAFDSYASTGFGSPVGHGEARGNLNNKISSLSPSLKGMRYCSFPIMGDTEAIYNQLQGAIDGFRGPWCTLWGPMTPRNSTAVMQTDYSLVNAALKFKSLAHDLFGVPRGAKERWSLAYPWEETPGSPRELEKFLHKLKDILPEALGRQFFGSNTGRSSILAIPGDPRMVDYAFPSTVDAMNFAKEIAYLASLNTAASEAEKRAIEAMKRQHGVRGPTTSSEILSAQERELSRAENDTAIYQNEEIWELRRFCHASADKKGTFVGRARHSFGVGYEGLVTPGSDLRFAMEGSRSRCHGHDIGHCLKRDYRGKCKRKRRGQLVYYARFVKVGERKTPHPKIWKIERGICDASRQETATKIRDLVTCRDRKVLVRQVDSREYLERPDPNRPQDIVKENSETARQVGQAARVATWVGAELARAKYEEYSGRSLLPGKKRVYTIHEEVTCKPKGYTVQVAGVTKYGRCEDSVRFEIKRMIQEKLLRKLCDIGLKSPLGEPFKRGE